MIRAPVKIFPCALAVVSLGLAVGFAAEEPPFRIERSVVLTSPADLHFAQSRAALIPGDTARVILTTQQTEKAGAHGYRDIFVAETLDRGGTWSAPARIENLRRARNENGDEIVAGDLCPQWHANTRTVLATGKTFTFRGGKAEDRTQERVSYAVYSPERKEWSGLKLLELPAQDHEGKPILQPNSGCVQRCDRPGGEILLPVRYRKDAKQSGYTTIVTRCTFDGQTLTYREHGSELGLSDGLGLYEPSLIEFGSRFFLTLRGDRSGYVTRSQDGLNYEPIVEWKYDDGKPLGNYNTQQHWVTHSSGLYLVYTRKGANNDHVFRHRAPLFIARVDPDQLCIIRSTEQILMPETGLDLGAGFGVMEAGAGETWVISSEMSFPKERAAESNRVLLAKIIWK